MSYVLCMGEDDVPEGLKEALRRGNRLQNILAGEIGADRTGNEILFATLDKANSEAILSDIMVMRQARRLDGKEHLMVTAINCRPVAVTIQ